MSVTDAVSYKASGAWDKIKPVFEEKNLEYKLFDEVGSNLTYDGYERLAEEDACAFLSIG